MYEIDDQKPTSTERIATIFASIGQFLLSFLETIVVALVISIALYLFIMTPHEVVGSSMYPTYKDGEYLMANKIIYKFSDPKRGDVIIFKYSDTQDFIKRIIGLPGDQVMLKDGHIYINGTELDESGYLDSSVYTNGGEYLHEGETITIPANEYFVCGDNREHSSDSRSFGPIEKSAIKGKAWVVYYPFSSFRIATHQSYQAI
jgi:signal peptidase I